MQIKILLLGLNMLFCCQSLVYAMWSITDCFKKMLPHIEKNTIQTSLDMNKKLVYEISCKPNKRYSCIKRMLQGMNDTNRWEIQNINNPYECIHVEGEYKPNRCSTTDLFDPDVYYLWNVRASATAQPGQSASIKLLCSNKGNIIEEQLVQILIVK